MVSGQLPLPGERGVSRGGKGRVKVQKAKYGAAKMVL